MMIADNTTIWRNKFENTIHHKNLCGNSRYGDQINMYIIICINSPVMKVFEHNNKELNLTMQGMTPKSTCEASFAIDNLIISIR